MADYVNFTDIRAMHFFLQEWNLMQKDYTCPETSNDKHIIHGNKKILKIINLFEPYCIIIIFTKPFIWIQSHSIWDCFNFDRLVQLVELNNKVCGKSKFYSRWELVLNSRHLFFINGRKHHDIISEQLYAKLSNMFCPSLS